MSDVSTVLRRTMLMLLSVACASVAHASSEVADAVMHRDSARFEKLSRVTHDDKAPCRKTGADSCTYVVTW